MAPAIFLKNGRIIDPASNMDMKAGLLIREGKIDWIGEGTPPGDDNYVIIDVDGCIVCHGFIDLHCHLRQPGYEEAETIATGTRAAAKGGFTTVCCMPNTNPPIDSPEMVRYIYQTAAAQGKIRVMPIACVTIGRQGEEIVDMNELELAGACAFSDDGAPVTSPDIMRQALLYSHDFGIPIMDHCENMFLSQGGQVNFGPVAAKLELRGIPAEAEELIVKRNLDLARETGGHIHICHVSTAGSVELIRAAKQQNVPVTAEATPHHLTLTEDIVLEQKTMAKVNPPLRSAADRKALVAGLNEGVIDAVATDHAPHKASDKNCRFEDAAFGISGFETALSSLVGLVMKSEIGLNTLIESLTVAPARILGYSKFGVLETGLPAEITVFDLHREWTVNPAEFVSKGKNTPLAGKKMHGKVMLTIYNGEVVYADESMLEPE